MTWQQDLSILDTSSALAPLNRDAHIKIQQCINSLHDRLKQADEEHVALEAVKAEQAQKSVDKPKKAVQ